MGRAGVSRGLGLGKLVLWIGLLVILAVVGCSSEGDPAPAAAADATSSVDQVDLPDSDEAQKAACEAKNGDCVKAYWSDTGTCVLAVNLGTPCGSGPAECRGTCDGEGQCSGPGSQTSCGKGAPECSRCDGKGSCSFFIPGAACKDWNPGECKETHGFCEAFGVCTTPAAVGAFCSSPSPGCGPGVCDAAAKCVSAKVGAPCPIANPAICTDKSGVCDADGQCKLVPKAVGSPCPIAAATECVESTGVCGADGGCNPVFKPVGAPCANSGAAECAENAGTCIADGTCKLAPKAKGTPCGPVTWTGCGNTCNGAGQCVQNPGAACTVPSDSYCPGQPGVCNTAGYCAAGLPCGKAYFPQPCGDFALGQACKKTYAIPGYPQNCSAPSAYPTANSNSCGDAGDPCQPKLCSVDLYSSATCTAGQMPDGAPCPGVAANPCSAATCLSGKCQTALKPAGTPCTPLAPKVCGQHECNAAGECAAVVPAVPLAGSCTLSDGDTDCWVKSCDSAGTCTKVPRPAGEACGAVADDACSAHRCDGKGWCVPQLTSETALCKHSDCLLPTATYFSPCPVGPCVDSGCMKLGLCHTSYKKAGASCEINKMAGTCDADHHCNLTGKGSESLVGKLCIGHFPCMKEDVAYGEDGACHGTIATGEICGTPCKPGICGVDGTCQLSLAPTGTTCGATDNCGKLECDGKGECGFPQASVGTTCSNPSWPQPAECEQRTCNVKGECLTTAAVGKSCKTPSPCLVGTCTKYSKCGYDPISGPVCDLPKPDPCNTGLCKAGICEPVPKSGGACGKETACMAYQCGATGQCEGIPKPGATCESTGTCTKGVCDLAGQCTQVLDPGAKCASEKQCMEGMCSATGACEFGPKAAGSQCLAVAFGTNWDCYTGACDGKGGCTLKVNTGAKCLQGASPCKEGVCQSDASCKAVPANLGKACSNGCMADAVCTPTGECKGKPTPGKTCYDQCFSDATCNAQGECKGVAKVGQLCYGPSKSTLCQSSTCNSDGNCVKSDKAVGTPCEVGVAGYGEVPSYPCGSKTGTCNGGTCVPAFTDPDGTPCGTDDGCAEAHVCRAGLCLPVEPKPNGTPCKNGCTAGTCMLGGCGGPTVMDIAGSDCDDGDVCTFDYCAGGPLPGMNYFLGVAWPTGKCFTMKNGGACPSGKPPKPTPKCLIEGCPVNECGIELICQNLFTDGDYACVQPPNTWGWPPPACYVDNPCVTVGCTNEGNCSYQPLDYPKQCGAFKHCYKGECVPTE